MFCSQPVPEELQNGDGFGYIIAFRPLGLVTWTRAAISTPGIGRYVFRNDTIPAFSPFEVKVGAYNNRGEGPFSSIATVFSAEEGTRRMIFGAAMITALFMLSFPSPTQDQNVNLI